MTEECAHVYEEAPSTVVVLTGVNQTLVEVVESNTKVVTTQGTQYYYLLPCFYDKTLICL